MNTANRYKRNTMMLSETENRKLRDFKVCVIGCGGLGGNIIEQMGRLGIGYITAVDGDRFDETNLNRQLLASMNTLGEYKAQAAKDRMQQVNPDVEVNPIIERLSEDNGDWIFKGHDLIIDATDNVGTRRLMKRYVDKFNIPMIHGAIAAWYGQVAVIYPGDDLLDKIYPSGSEKGIESTLGNPSFTPAIVAGIQVSEGLKVLLNKGEILKNKLLYINLLDHEYTIVDMN